MVTIAQLLEWRPATLDSLAEFFYDKRSPILRLQDEIQDSRPPESWNARAAAPAERDHQNLRLRLNDLAADVAKLAVTLKETSSKAKDVQNDLQDLLSDVSGDGFTIDHDSGDITAPKIVVKPDHKFDGDPAIQQADVNKRFAERKREQDAKLDSLHDRLQKILDRAQWVDVELAKAMQAVTENEVDGGKGSLAKAAEQEAPDLTGLTPEEIADELGGMISKETLSAFVNLESTFGYVKVEGAGKATYSVMLDGSVRMDLHLEGGLGLGVGEEEGANAGLTGGLAGDYGLEFKSVDEATRFLKNLKDAAAPSWKDLGAVLTHDAGAEIAAASRIKNLLADQHVYSERVGVYMKGEAKVAGVVGGDIRGDMYYDRASHEYGAKVAGEIKVGGLDGKAGGEVGAKLEGEVKTRTNGELKSITLGGELEGAVAQKRLGINLPGGSGSGVDVELKMDEHNVMWPMMKEALSHGDMQTAADLAMDQGEVVVRQTSSEVVGTDEVGGSSQSANHLWVRGANTQHFTHIDPLAVPGHSAREGSAE